MIRKDEEKRFQHAIEKLEILCQEINLRNDSILLKEDIKNELKDVIRYLRATINPKWRFWDYIPKKEIRMQRTKELLHQIYNKGLESK